MTFVLFSSCDILMVDTNSDHHIKEIQKSEPSVVFSNLYGS